VSFKDLRTLSVGGGQSTSNFVYILCLAKTNIIKIPLGLSQQNGT